MKAEKLLHLTLEENGYDEFVTKGIGFSQTIVEAMERYAKDYHENKVKKLNIPDVMQQSGQLFCNMAGKGFCSYEYENGKCKVEGTCTNHTTK